ncbi:sigma-70 family RNA polymerase sigma factor [Pedobacter sp. BMA]|uniref:sigma-70 family RNA polymerase sigma factor n=1 Tax=Pedobacter sp. BMA TaxID=1663685 RepID=UPI00064B19FE|nr:sigma-70 family RNA polymerase sigma factor [Pedobacter sp. BMA]KLT64352.1 RNA polymerase sigma factor [Pedobacter sp. BMA]
MKTQEFSALIYNNTDALHRHAMRFTADSDDANDLIQDTLIKALRFSHQFEKGSDLKAWLFVIMKNTFINDYRKKTKRASIITSEDNISSSHLMQSATRNAGEHQFLMRDIQLALSKLPEAYRIPFIRYFEGFKYEEIATELNIPLGTVKTHIHQARHLLKKQLKNYKDDAFRSK